MPYFEKEPEIERLKRAVMDCYMMACRKRSVIFNYNDPDNPKQIGPKSDDSDWDHIKRFCESTGIRQSVVRLA